MEDFEKKVSISESASEIQVEEDERESEINRSSKTTVALLRRFLSVQQRRALAYARLKR
ncbi:hypothetical protein MIMGU_mgv1a0140422mg, partial [Erythranthe guttata]